MLSSGFFPLLPAATTINCELLLNDGDVSSDDNQCRCLWRPEQTLGIVGSTKMWIHSNKETLSLQCS